MDIEIGRLLNKVYNLYLQETKKEEKLRAVEEVAREVSAVVGGDPEIYFERGDAHARIEVKNTTVLKRISEVLEYIYWKVETKEPCIYLTTEKPKNKPLNIEEASDVKDLISNKVREWVEDFVAKDRYYLGSTKIAGVTVYIYLEVTVVYNL